MQGNLAPGLANSYTSHRARRKLRIPDLHLSITSSDQRVQVTPAPMLRSVSLQATIVILLPELQQENGDPLVSILTNMSCANLQAVLQLMLNHLTKTTSEGRGIGRMCSSLTDERRGLNQASPPAVLVVAQ